MIIFVKSPVRDEIHFALANTYTQIHIKAVFLVHIREFLIDIMDRLAGVFNVSIDYLVNGNKSDKVEHPLKNADDLAIQTARSLA